MSVEERLARIAEEEAAAKQHLDDLRDQKEKEYPQIANYVNTRLVAARHLGIVPIIEEFTKEELAYLYVPDENEEVTEGLHLPRKSFNTEEFRKALQEIEAAERRWHAFVLTPELDEDLKWNTDLRIKIHNASHSSFRKKLGERGKWIDVALHDGSNILEIVGGEQPTFNGLVYPRSNYDPKAPTILLDNIEEAMAQAVHNPKYESRSLRELHNFVIR